MTCQPKLIIIKLIHTIIWIFFNLVLFDIAYEVITNKIDILFWLGVGLIILEFLVLLFFKMLCPLTIMAQKYSNSTKENFDIYLPNWLAKHNKLIYTSILVAIIIIHIYQVLK